MFCKCAQEAFCWIWFGCGLGLKCLAGWLGWLADLVGLASLVGLVCFLAGLVGLLCLAGLVGSLSSLLFLNPFLYMYTHFHPTCLSSQPAAADEDGTWHFFSICVASFLCGDAPPIVSPIVLQSLL